MRKFIPYIITIIICGSFGWIAHSIFNASFGITMLLCAVLGALLGYVYGRFIGR